MPPSATSAAYPTTSRLENLPLSRCRGYPTGHPRFEWVREGWYGLLARDKIIGYSCHQSTSDGSRPMAARRALTFAPSAPLAMASFACLMISSRVGVAAAAAGVLDRAGCAWLT